MLAAARADVPRRRCDRRDALNKLGEVAGGGSGRPRPRFSAQEPSGAGARSTSSLSDGWAPSSLPSCRFYTGSSDFDQVATQQADKVVTD